MITGPIIAEIAALVGDPARATMLSSLLDGRARAASELARAAHVTPQTASAHLGKLTGAGLLSMVRHGRHRYFRLAGPSVGDMLDGIAAVALLKRPRQPPLSGDARALAAARICYGHLAGRLSIELIDALVARDHVVLHESAAEITTAGARFLTRFGIALGSRRGSRRHVCRLCLDWTERRPHLAGTMGAALAARYVELGWVEQRKDSQAVRVTAAGRRGFLKTFGIDVAAPGARRSELSTLRSSSK
jgi:DNA-binding transcriptional ArsR family regulator